MATVGDLWRQVVESPDDIGLRLVLADALIEQGDSRGELIALQCRGADASVLVDVDLRAHADNVAERVSELIVANWRIWLGELWNVVVRQGATFQNGLLSQIQVTSEHATPTAEHAKHHELCALRRIRPYKMRADAYATLLANLVHDPETVEITAPNVIRQIREQRTRWGIRCLRYGGHWSPRPEQTYVFTAELERLAQIAPQLHTLEVLPNWGIGEELVALVPRLPKMFPQLRKVKLEDTRFGWVRDHEDKLRALPLVVLD